LRARTGDLSLLKTNLNDWQWVAASPVRCRS
jgi:hypothetical protein